MENDILGHQIETCRGADVKNLFDDYYGRLVYFSYQLINNKPQAEDIAQDAFVKFWDNSHHVSNNPAAIKNFLYSTVKNASLNVIRHNKVAEQHINSLPGIPSEDAIFNNIVRTEVLTEIYNAITLLPDSCQQIFRMSYLDDMKNNQIADVLGISVNTVKTQKQRAIKVLRGHLSPELFVVLIALAETLYDRTKLFNKDATSIIARDKLRPVPQVQIDATTINGQPMQPGQKAAYQNPGW